MIQIYCFSIIYSCSELLNSSPTKSFSLIFENQPPTMPTKLLVDLNDDVEEKTLIFRFLLQLRTAHLTGIHYKISPLGESQHFKGVSKGSPPEKKMFSFGHCPNYLSPPHSEAILELFKMKSCPKIKRNATRCNKIVLFTKIISFFGCAQNNFFPK